MPIPFSFPVFDCLEGNSVSRDTAALCFSFDDCVDDEKGRGIAPLEIDR